MDTQTSGSSDLGTRIRHRRQALGLSTAEVAERSGLATDRIEYIETRPAALTGAELVRLSHALDLSVQDLTAADRPRTPRRPPVAPALEPMRKVECRRLIEAGSVGRIAYQGSDGLVVIPVNYCTLGDLVIFRTASDSTVAQYDLAPIVFQLDAFDEGMHDGWSVLVDGTVRPAVAAEIEAVHDNVEPWAGGTRDTYLAIEPRRITGRRIRSW
ncbi:MULTISPECIES: helix-turn-helix domain-containing protein [Kribbella]|uniref:HTH cro/C1-type domain-containing protein n=1 Tax=Kribbella karoonensis TaxID=324851 RepID=A0ABN2EB53_9ACTN